MIELLKSIVIEQQMTVLLVSHQPPDALFASKSTAFISKGRVLSLLSTEQPLRESTLVEVNDYLGKS